MEEISNYFKSLNDSVPDNILTDDKSATIENYEIYDGIEEVPIKDNTTYYPHQYDTEIRNEYYKSSKKFSNIFNLNTTPFTISQSFQDWNYLNNNNNIYNDFSSSRRTNNFFPKNNNVFEFNNYINKTNIKSQNSPIKKTKSKYSSVSENKYHFLKKIGGNQKYENPLLSENNIFKINMAPINYEKTHKKQMNKSFEIYNNDNSIGDYIYNTNYNTINILNQNPIQNQYNINNYIYTTRNNNDIKNNNNIVNNKSTSNYNYNTINISKFQDSKDILKLAQNNNTNNKLISDYNILTNVNDNSHIYNKTLGYKYLSNNNISFNKNQAKQFTFDHIRNNVKIQNKEPEYATVTPISVLNIVKEPEYATVTKISSIHKREGIIKNNSLINPSQNQNQALNKNISKTNKLSFNSMNLMINDEQNKKEELIEDKKELNEKINQNMNVMNLNKDINININQNINQNNQIVEQPNKYINQDNQEKEIQEKNNIPINQNKQIVDQQNKQDLNVNQNTQLVNKKGINKIKKISIVKTTNTNENIKDDNKKIDMNQQVIKSITPQPSSDKPSRSSKKLGSIYKKGTNKIIVSENLIITKNTNPLNNPSQNVPKFYKPELEKTTAINDDNNLKNKEKTNSNLNVMYNDFDGTGYVKNYCGVSRPGKDMMGNTKINQDSVVCLTNINNVKDFNIFGVLDGHGPEGHFVSKYISNYIPSQLINHPEIKKLKNPEKIYKKFKENNCKIITDAFVSSDEVLKNVDFDVLQSGTTCCLIIHIGKHILCANTGDSRALVAFDESNNINSKNLNKLKAVALSIDYKPELPEESKRIMMAGGVIEKMRDEYGQGVGPFRVWKGEEDYPGLAMSRSIGDFRGKTVGIIPNPGILEYDLNKTTKFVIVCSDGVFEYMSNDKVKDLGKKYYLENNASEYCHQLLIQSFDQWLKKDTFVDDITAVVAFF